MRKKFVIVFCISLLLICTMTGCAQPALRIAAESEHGNATQAEEYTFGEIVSGGEGEQAQATSPESVRNEENKDENGQPAVPMESEVSQEGSSSDVQQSVKPVVIAEEDSEEEIVHWTAGGEVYHTDPACSALARSKEILSGSIADSGKDRVCKICAAEE